MAKSSKKSSSLIGNGNLVTQNRRAKFDYHIEETFEAGIILFGSEVKSAREGKASIQEAYITVNNGRVELINASIEDYSNAGYSHHEPRRVRELLMHKKEIIKLWQATQKKGRTIVPLRMYFNDYGKLKLLIGLAVGKTKSDKRETVKDRDWKREQGRIMRNYNN